MWLSISKMGAYLVSPLSVVLCMSLLGCGLLLCRWHRLGMAGLLSGLALLFLVSLPPVADLAVSTLEQRYPVIAVEDSPSTELVVVLGGSINMPYGQRLSVEMTESSDRVLHGFRLLKAGKAQQILLVGGNVDLETWPKSEAEYIAELLLEWGVPADSILLEGRSQTTYENAIYTARFLNEHKLQDQSVLLVTSAIHMPRSVAVFEAAGVNVLPAPTDISVLDQRYDGLSQWLPTIGAISAVDRAMHEYIGLLVYRLRGWL